MRAYLAFLRRHPGKLALGVALTFFGSFGQTYFIALFGGEIRAQFGLTPGGFGAVYSAATLTSAALMIQAGAMIDRVALRPYIKAIVLGLTAPALLFSFLDTASVIVLFITILLLRLCGQGLMGHTASTIMARDFDRDRGKAISLATLGHSAGEAVFPLIAVALMALWGWRGTWLAVAGVLALVALPLLMRLSNQRPGAVTSVPIAPLASGQTGDWTRRRVLLDPAFYLLLPATLAPPFINTGIFFHQVPLVEAKSWPLALFASAFTTYAVVTVAATLYGGRLVDRTSAGAVLRYALLPLALGLAVLAAMDHPLAAHGYMVLAGMSQGLFYTIATALWAELYGLRHLGAIRALATSMMVISTGLSPALFGWLIDAGVAIDTILTFCALWCMAAIPLVVAALRLVSARS